MLGSGIDVALDGGYRHEKLAQLLIGGVLRLGPGKPHNDGRGGRDGASSQLHVKEQDGAGDGRVRVGLAGVHEAPARHVGIVWAHD